MFVYELILILCACHCVLSVNTIVETMLIIAAINMIKYKKWHKTDFANLQMIANISRLTKAIKMG